jgi:hypothetical protein
MYLFNRKQFSSHFSIFKIQSIEHCIEFSFEVTRSQPGGHSALDPFEAPKSTFFEDSGIGWLPATWKIKGSSCSLFSLV